MFSCHGEIGQSGGAGVSASSAFVKGYGGTSVTQRGNRRQETSFSDDDYGAYVGLMAEWCGRWVTTWEGTGAQWEQRPY